MRPLVVVMLAACGRIGFDAQSDGSLGDRGNGDVAGVCSEGIVTDLGPTGGYSISRLPAGWLVVTIDPAGTQIELHAIGDDGVVGAPRVATGITAPMNLLATAMFGDSLTAMWTEGGIIKHGRFALDGTMIDSASLGNAIVSRATARDDLTFLIEDGSTKVSVTTLDAAGALGNILPVESGVSPLSAAHGEAGYLVMTSNGPSRSHLVGLDESGTIVLPDMSVPAAALGQIVWTGAQYVAMMAATDSTTFPSLVVLDASFALVSGPSQLGTQAGVSALAMREDSLELGVAASVITPSAGVRFQTTDLVGTATSAVQFFDTGVSTGIYGPEMAGGPGRYAMVWGIGSPITATLVAVACR